MTERSPMEERPRDYCACGRMKDKTDYCCWPCFAKGHPTHRPGTKPKHQIEYVRVVASPDPDFRPGAEFTATEFGLKRMGREDAAISTLDMGNWPEGLAVEYMGDIYQVVGEPGKRQRLEARA